MKKNTPSEEGSAPPPNHFRRRTIAHARHALNLHLISDSTGETLMAMVRAAMAHYPNVTYRENLHALISTPERLSELMDGIGVDDETIILFTFSRDVLARRLSAWCRERKAVCVNVLAPILDQLKHRLGKETYGRIGAQHNLDESYFSRIEAMNFTLAHDDGQNVRTLKEADIVLIGISRTSKTPTSIYLANRGYKTANFPLIPGAEPPEALDEVDEALIVGLIAAPRHLAMFRRSRLQSMGVESDESYADLRRIGEEIAVSRDLFARRKWPVIDVTQRSIEETAAAVMTMFQSRRRNLEAHGEDQAKRHG